MKLFIKLFQAAQHQLKLLMIILCGMSITLVMQTTQAEALKDPTQPPDSVYSHTVTNDDQEIIAGPVLQSVMIGSQYRSAIINGQKVMLGKKYGQATLISLDEHKAVLRNQDMTTQTLLMDYVIEKKIVSPAASPPATKRKVTHSSKPIVVSEK
jgi:MSHA biogenesis protein MshK